MLIGIGVFLVFLAMASLMYTRRLSALLALPLMAFAIAIIGGIPAPDILSAVLGSGALKLHSAYTTTMFGAVLAELINRQGIAKALIRWVAEFSGDNPFILGILLTAITALLFSTLGGLGAVIMVGTIVLPVMLSIGITNLTAGGLFLFGISLGGMFNLANWQLYVDVLHISQAEITKFVIPFTGIMWLIVMIFLALDLKRLKNLLYIAGAVIFMCAAFWYQQFSEPSAQTTVASSLDPVSTGIVSAIYVMLAGYALFRHQQKLTSVPGIALFTPFVPLLLVLSCHWEIIPAFIAGITYGALVTWQANSINSLTRSILDGIANVIPAVVLMIGIGMLLTAVMHPQVSSAMSPMLAKVIPTRALPYIFVFTIIAPLALYRGPLSLWGMGSGLVALMQKTTALASQAIMGMLMSVGQIQGVCDPTNTHNIWIATYLGTDTQALMRRTIAFVWLGVFSGLVLSVAMGYVPW